MTATIEAKKERLAISKKRIEFQEKLLREKEKKFRTKRLIQMGSLFEKAGIDNLDKSSLIGALMEIKALSKDKKKVAEWKDHGEKYLNTDTNENLHTLLISFEGETDKEAVGLLRQNNFKWNRFRKEWYGYGIKSEIESTLKNFNPSVEVLEN